MKYGGLRFTEAAHVKDFIAAARVVANPADNLAWFRLLRLHEGIGPVLARRVMDALRADRAGAAGAVAEAAADCLPPRVRPALSATVGQLIAAAGLERTADRADRDPGRPARPGERPVRRRRRPAGRPAAAGRRGGAAGRHCTRRWSSWRWTRRSSGSDLAGRPRLDDDFLVISTVHSAKGLEWPVVHLPQLVDGAVPSDMALSTPAGWPRSTGCSTWP